MTDATATIKVKEQVIVWKDGVQYLIDKDRLDDFFSQPPKDLVEVVRCKECKWRGEYLSCPIPYRTDDDFFCKKGEPK